MPFITAIGTRQGVRDRAQVRFVDKACQNDRVEEDRMQLINQPSTKC
jgi:hypothetical protein